MSQKDDCNLDSGVPGELLISNSQIQGFHFLKREWLTH